MDLCAHHICGYCCRSSCTNFTCTKCKIERPHEPAGNASQLLLHAKIYLAAVEYGLPGLVGLAIDKFRGACVVYWESDQFIVAAEHVFTASIEEDVSLKNIVVSTLAAHRGLLTSEGMRPFLQQRPELMYQLLTQNAR